MPASKYKHALRKPALCHVWFTRQLWWNLSQTKLGSCIKKKYKCFDIRVAKRKIHCQVEINLQVTMRLCRVFTKQQWWSDDAWKFFLNESMGNIWKEKPQLTPLGARDPVKTALSAQYTVTHPMTSTAECHTLSTIKDVSAQITQPWPTYGEETPVNHWGKTVARWSWSNQSFSIAESYR